MLSIYKQKIRIIIVSLGIKDLSKAKQPYEKYLPLVLTRKGK